MRGHGIGKRRHRYSAEWLVATTGIRIYWALISILSVDIDVMGFLKMLEPSASAWFLVRGFRSYAC